MTPASTASAKQALAGIRVLDVAGPFGNYCGKLFADLGADVVLVEPPTGAPTRHRPPFADIDDQNLSLTFAYENTSKRGIVLDLDSEQGRAALRDLVKSADLLVETEKPGVMAARGLGATDLRSVNPGLVYSSITGFGQTGPYADYECEDIVALALGGLLALAGEPGSPPLAAYGFQAIGAANLFAAVASLVAVMEAERTGQGEHVDVSMQECVTMGLENAAQFYDLERVVRKRTGTRFARAGLGVFPCRDGLVFLMAAGVGSNQFWPKTVDWLAEEGVANTEALRDPRWEQDMFLYTDEAKQAFADVFEPFAAVRDMQTLYDEGQRRRIPICPVRAPSDALIDPQLIERRFFVHAASNLFGPSFRMPGAPYKLSETPWAALHPAPTLGQHTAEVLATLDLATERQVSAR